MSRLGAEGRPAAFAKAVALAYTEAQSALLGRGSIESLLRACHSYEVFREAMRRAGPAGRVLILGCGATGGLPGLSGEYARSEWLRLWPGEAAVTVCNLTADLACVDGTAALAGQYDAVVSHSQVHYVFEPSAFFRMVARAVAPGGAYVMGKEANARHWRNPEMAAALRDWKLERTRSKSWRARLSDAIPESWRPRWSRRSERVEDFANRRLRERGLVRRNLSKDEMSRWVEPHRPPDPPSPNHFGSMGFDVEAVREQLPGFALEWSGTSGGVGYVPRAAMPESWVRRGEELVSRYPGDGVYVSACYRKRR